MIMQPKTQSSAAAAGSQLQIKGCFSIVTALSVAIGLPPWSAKEKQPPPECLMFFCPAGRRMPLMRGGTRRGYD